MLFLIAYNRSSGLVASMKAFDDAQRRVAENARLDLELDFNRRGIRHEVVLLQASSEQALRLTHRRYFEDFAELARSSASSTGNT